MSVRSRQHGISLVEVLVVIVILTIGIFSVIRLFPGGFLINQRTAEATMATRLAKAEMDRQATLAANLPDAIVGIRYDPVSGTLVLGDDIEPDDLTDVTQAPPGLTPYYLSNINRIRRILGETVRIPVGMPTAFGSGSIYTLSNAPIYAPRVNDTFAGITVYGAAMLRREQEADLTDPMTGLQVLPALGGPSQYAIDYGGADGSMAQAQIGFYSVPYARRFRIKYSYYDQDDGYKIKSDIVDLPDARDTLGEVDPADPTKRVLPAGFVGWIPMVRFRGDGSSVPLLLVSGSEEVSREFRQLPAIGPSDSITWDADPFEFRVFQDTLAPAGVANLGVLVFNPQGRSYTEQTSSGSQPLTARIDYDVLDWRIIREERSMPGSAPYRFALGLRGIMKSGDILDDQSTYTGMFPGGPSPDFMVIDLSTGAVVPPSNYQVDYNEGIVTFTPTFGDAHASGTFRILYKAHGGWGLQVQKAVARMTQTYAFPPPFGQFTLGMHRKYAGDPDPHPVLYVSLSEAGKTISIRELWYLVAGSSTPQHASNETYRVRTRAELIAAGDNYETASGRPVTWIDLRDRHPDAVAWATGAALATVSGVEGVSFKTRVIQDSGSHVTQTQNGNVVRARYRKFDLDTMLIRTQD